MVSKKQSKIIRSLNQKKYRFKHGLFLVEGEKAISEFLASGFHLHHLYSLKLFSEVPESLQTGISERDLKNLSQLTNPKDGLALFEIPKQHSNPDQFSETKIVALDGVRDPGNLGTIIRLCDWFGIKTLLCSNDTVDCFNPKVVQATMGSLTRVRVSYVDLEEALRRSKLNSYGTFMNGKSIYSEPLSEDFIIIMGNEANGISDGVEAVCKNRIAIPQFGHSKSTESLNVATATAITLNEFLRKTTTET